MVVQPTSGKFDGQGETRQHVVQFRGRSTPKAVTVNGKAIGKIAPVAPDSAALGSGAGWFVSGQSADGWDNFTQPSGVLVVAAGRSHLRSSEGDRVVVNMSNDAPRSFSLTQRSHLSSS